MEEVKQSLQETASKERESYKSVFLKKRSVCNRQSVYISGEIQKRIVQIVGVITNKQVSIGNFIDNVLEEHLGAHNDVLSALYREEIQKGIFNQPKEKDVWSVREELGHQAISLSLRGRSASSNMKGALSRRRPSRSSISSCVKPSMSNQR